MAGVQSVFGGGWHEIFTVNFQWREAARDQGQSRTNARNPFSTSFSPPFISRLFPFPTNTHRLLPHFRAVPAGKRHRQPPQVCPVGFSPANESRQSPLGGARVFRLCVLVAFKKMVVDSGGWVPWFFLGWWLVVVGTMMSVLVTRVESNNEDTVSCDGWSECLYWIWTWIFENDLGASDFPWSVCF